MWTRVWYYCLLLIKDLRWLRITHYLFMVFLGIAIAFLNFDAGLLTSPSSTLARDVVLCFFSALFSALFCIISNNIADIAIDTISNQDRPLITGAIAVSTYQKMLVPALLLALLFAFNIDGVACLMVACTLIIYYLYSVPPVRFKRVPLFSKLAISGNSLIIVLLGYYLFAHTFIAFPSIVIFIFLIGLTLAANLIDIKDIEGDRASGIHTLPVLWGETFTKKVASIGFVSIYIGLYFLPPHPAPIYVFALLGSAMGVLFILNQAKFQEKKLFLAFLLSAALMITLLLTLA